MKRKGKNEAGRPAGKAGPRGGTVITFANQKGGVGKTTTAHIVAVGLARRGYRVLACDMDPQANLTSVLGANKNDELVTIYELFEGDCAPADAIAPTSAGIDLMAGSLSLSGADRKYSATGDEYKLKEALDEVRGNYDYIIVDTPPALGVMSLNALACTDYLTVVLTPDYFSGKGLKQFEDAVGTARKYLSNPGLRINGLLLTRCDRTNIYSVANEDMEEAAEMLGTKIYRSRIRQGVAVRESQYLEASVYDMKGTAVQKDYDAFVDELLEDIKESSGSNEKEGIA